MRNLILSFMARPLSTYSVYTLRVFSVAKIESKLLLLKDSATLPSVYATARLLPLVGFDTLSRIRRELARAGSYARSFWLGVSGSEPLPVVVVITRKK